MVEPVTTGSLVAASLAAGASTLAAGALGAAGKDAYEKLKSLVSRISGGEVARLEEKPDSAHRAGLIAELIDEQSEPERSSLQELAERLRAALETEGHGALFDKRMKNQFNAYGQSRQYNAPGGNQYIESGPPGSKDRE